MAADKNKKNRDESPDEPVEPVVRDKRRIDPETGEARKDAQESGEQLTDEDLLKLLEEPLPAEAVSESEADAASEHLNDLKRVQAEYANYRKRVDRDRYVARELAVAEVITGILPVLDDLDLAHAHGDLEGSPLELVAQKLRTIFGRYGLVQVGEAGEPFDPNFHEAIAQVPSKGATGDTIAEVVQLGYRLGDRLLRPAKVAVSVPEE